MSVSQIISTVLPLFAQVDQAPVRLRKEIDGFALNRVQAAIIAESWRLVQVSFSPKVTLILSFAAEHVLCLRFPVFQKCIQDLLNLHHTPVVVR